MDARTEILAKIERAKAEPTTATRGPVATSNRKRSDIVDQFCDYVAEYKADVTRCTEADLKEQIGERLAGQRVLISADFPARWIPENLVKVEDVGLSVYDLDGTDAVLTLSAVGIAETGTIVLDAGVGQGRRAISLVPDRHVLLVPVEQIVDSVPEAVERLSEAVRSGQPLTWISGPSATSDIELSRVEGVHGPRQLEVIVFGDFS